MTIQPIGPALRREVKSVNEAYVQLAEEILERRLDRIPVLFDLSGTTAGMFKVHGKKRVIRYNPWIFAKYFEENIRDTVPHEVAHYVVHELYPRGRVKPHGSQWQTVMAAFGADPGVTFNLDLEGVPQRRQRTHQYFCDCRLHEVSTTRHNRVQRGTGRYYCCNCDSELIHAAHLSANVGLELGVS